MADTTSPSKLLADFLLAGELRASVAADDMSRRGLWANAVGLATQWRCLPQLRRRISSTGAKLPEDSSRQLAELSAVAAAQSAMVCHRASAAMRALESAGVKVAAFKGMALIASAYANPSERMLSDADILFERKDFAVLSRVLHEAGFEPAISIGLDSWIDLLDERVYPVHDFVDFIDANGVKLDLHWRIRAPVKNAFSISAVLERSVMLTISRESVRVAGAEDLLLLTSHHMVRERFTPRSAVKDLLDVAAMVDAHGMEWQIGSIIRRARETGLSISLLAALEILAEYQNANSEHLRRELVAACSDQEVRTARQFGEVFRLHLDRGGLSDSVIGLTDVTPTLAGKFIVSRLKVLRSITYRRHKFAGVDVNANRGGVRMFFRDIATLTPGRFAAYRALARETRAYTEENRSSSSTRQST